MTRRQLQRVIRLATLRAIEASEHDPDKANDFGQAARHWQRLADAADALDALLGRAEVYAASEATPPSNGVY